MPDLTREIYMSCETNRHWSMNFWSSDMETEYTVTWNNNAGYSCTCKGFKYRSECKHIKKVIKDNLRCGWHEWLDSEEQEIKGKCPKCGGETKPEIWMV